MKLIYYQKEPYFILHANDIFSDLLIKGKGIKYSKRHLEFLNYNNLLIKKMIEKKKIKNSYSIRQTLLSMFIDDALADVVKEVFLKNKIAVFKNYKIVKQKIFVDEEFLKSKEEAHKALEASNINKTYNILKRNDIKARKDIFLPFERIFLSDIRNEGLTIQLFFRPSNKKWKERTAQDTLLT